MTRAPPASTYDDDFFAWSREQAEALRRLPPSLVGPAVDIEHVAEEIEDLGKRDLREVESDLRRLIEHLVKIDACPDSRDKSHWFAEALHCQASALAAFSPSMRQWLDGPDIWKKGLKLASTILAEQGIATTVSTPCPFDLDDLLARDFDMAEALDRVASAKREVRRGNPLP